MAWVRKSDDHLDQGWWRRLGDIRPRVLWDGVLVKCNQGRTNGVIPDYMVEDWAYYIGLKTPRDQRESVAALVEVGAWHDHVTITDCDECLDAVRSAVGELNEGSYYHHGYLDTQPAAEELTDPIDKRRARRRKQLHRDDDMCTAVRTRDHDRCRYCGTHVNFKARTGDQSGTYDHLNPMDFGSARSGDNDGGNAVHKLVVACRRCNGVKKNRTPDEAGMPLLPLPANVAHVDPETGEVLVSEGAVLAGPGPVLAPDQECLEPGQDLAQENTTFPEPSPGPGQDPRAPAREAGPGQDGPGPDQERARAGPGRGQDGSGRSGSVKAGSGRGRSGRAGPGKAGGGPSRAGSGRGRSGRGEVGSGPPSSRPVVVSDPVGLVEQAFDINSVRENS